MGAPGVARGLPEAPSCAARLGPACRERWMRRPRGGWEPAAGMVRGTGAGSPWGRVRRQDAGWYLKFSRSHTSPPLSIVTVWYIVLMVGLDQGFLGGSAGEAACGSASATGEGGMFSLKISCGRHLLPNLSGIIATPRGRVGGCGPVDTPSGPVWAGRAGAAFTPMVIHEEGSIRACNQHPVKSLPPAGPFDRLCIGRKRPGPGGRAVVREFFVTRSRAGAGRRIRRAAARRRRGARGPPRSPGGMRAARSTRCARRPGW